MKHHKHHILIVEDEHDLRDILEYNLKKEGYFVSCAATGKEAMDALLQSELPDLVLLDLMLPDMGGIDICSSIRGSSKTEDIAVLMLTAKGEEVDRVAGFEVGADDYVTKPFSVRELMLRVKSLLKRRPAAAPDIFNFGVLRVDLPEHRVFIEDRETSLTSLEFNLLKTFFTRKGRVQTREVLLSDVWSINADVTTRTVDTHVKRLREKLGSASAYIETVRGVGYRFVKTL